MSVVKSDLPLVDAMGPMKAVLKVEKMDFHLVETTAFQ